MTKRTVETLCREVDNMVNNLLHLSRHRFVLWLAAQKKLLTKDRMADMGIGYDKAACVLCDQDGPEDHTHLFVDCEWSKAVWSGIEQWLGVQVPQVEANMVLQFIQNKHWCRMKKEVIAVVHGARIYFIWQARNWKIFKGITVNTSSIVQQIQFIVRGRIEMFIDTKQARKCIGYLEALCN
ncbi:uncharacterized protein LOC132631388 [Lycium barbarum]|uniref:uncharacterized protein LOC132631388 n=1 Tax=Lycium barbarum TaxID=112863 RepID=UPI00293E8D44|nr:uncharacterized protein LOC132631388 [Lycium barbarum]